MITLRRIVGLAFPSLMAVLVLSGCVSSRTTTKTGQMLSPHMAQHEKPADKADSDSALRLARLLREQGRYEAALGVYAKLNERGTMTPRELLEYANTASLVHPPRATLSLFVRAREAASETETELTGQELAELHTGLGRARMALGQFDLARKNLETALKAAPDSVAALNAMGVLLDTQGNHEEARKPLTRANELAPSDERILNNLALSYLSSGDSRQAIRLFNQASSLSDSPSLGLNRAFAYYLRGQEEKAQGTLQELMPRKQTETFMTMFRKMQERVSTGESTLSEELLRAAGKLIAISPPIKNEGNARGTSGSSADRVTS